MRACTTAAQCTAAHTNALRQETWLEWLEAVVDVIVADGGVCVCCAVHCCLYLCAYTSQVLARFRHELVILGQPAEAPAATGDAAATAVKSVGLTAAQRAATSK